MDDDAFLDRVRAALPGLLGPKLAVRSVRTAEGRPWPRVEVVFDVVGAPPGGGSPSGAAYAPFDAQWREDDGCEEPDDYAHLLADAVRAAASRLAHPDRVGSTPTRAQVEERWSWLLERLALSGRVDQHDRDRLVVTGEDGWSFTVLVSPEQWAQIAEPLDPDADDPQDFDPVPDEEGYLVFYEDRLAWSVRAELPPVRWGADLARRARAARSEGRRDVGWFTLDRSGQPVPFEPDAGR